MIIVRNKIRQKRKLNKQNVQCIFFDKKKPKKPHVTILILHAIFIESIELNWSD